MTYAIIKTGGKQIKVSAGDNIWIEKVVADQGNNFVIKDVLAVYDDKQLNVGRPMLSGAEVTGVVIKQGKGPKIRILRYKEKSNWERRQGHRQPYTKLLITEIKLNGTVIAKAEAKKAPAVMDSKPAVVEKVEKSQTANTQPTEAKIEEVERVE